MPPLRSAGSMLYQFGDVTMNVETRQISRGSTEIHLTPKAFDLLKLLVDNRARAVPKSELQESLWPSVFVDETNLATIVGEIRRALADDAAHPRYIRTVYGFGYRFIGDALARGAPQQASRVSLLLGGREILLMEGVNVIGRAPDAAIQIDAPSISRYHARILVTSGAASLEDADSKNGTQVNGARITAPTALSDGDKICLGSVELTFRTAPPISPTVTLPPASPE